MKALIICSVHALCNISDLERDACHRVCTEHGIPGILTERDHGRAMSSATMLGLLATLSGSEKERKALVAEYLETLNESIWTAPLAAYQSVIETLLAPETFGRPTGFVSDYPVLTTNLVRSAALMTSASRLGRLVAPDDGRTKEGVAADLAACAAKLSVAHENVEVRVAHRRDYLAARSLGMHPRYVDELALARFDTEPDRETEKDSPLRHPTAPNRVGEAIFASF